MAKAHEHLEDARVKVRTNIVTEENPYGLLTRGKENYLKCLEFDYRGLEDFMRQDEAHWAEHFEVVKRDSLLLKDKIEAMLIQ